MSKPSESYSQILKSSSIIGGAQGIQYVISLIRARIVADFLGPAGDGLLAMYQSTLQVLTNIALMGMGPSGVRQIADATAKSDPTRASRMAKIVGRVCWVTGVIGWALTVLMARPISEWTFGSSENAQSIAILGAALVLGSAAAGQMAILQGFRRLRDLALVNVFSGLVATLVCLPVYYYFGTQGIVPIFILTAALTWGFAAWGVRRMNLESVQMGWKEALADSKHLVGLGLAFMWSGVITSLGELTLKALVTRELGEVATGLYQAAWSISGMFALFIINAMGADFYPRLTATISDKKAASDLVNQQTEIGILMALPGLVASLAFAPGLMLVLKNRLYLPAADLLPWFIVGLLFRVISWPMGYVMLAQGASRWFVATETFFVALHVGMGFFAIEKIGLQGVSVAFAALYIIYTICMRALSRHLIGLEWSAGVWRLMFLAGLMVALGFGAERLESFWISSGAGVIVTGAASVFSLRGVAHRLGSDHRWIQLAMKLPGARLALRGIL